VELLLRVLPQLEKPPQLEERLLPLQLLLLRVLPLQLPQLEGALQHSRERASLLGLQR
jgi:hypothetical protein